MRVFVCHASEDKDLVRNLCGKLREDGFEPWLDEERLLPGQDWELELSAAVRSSEAVIVCLSTASVGKVGYVQKELRLVLDAAEYQPEGRIFVVPVRLDACSLPIRLSRWQYADLFKPNGYQRLKAALTTRTEAAPDEGTTVRQLTADSRELRPIRGRRLAIVAITTLLMIAGGTALYQATMSSSRKVPSTPTPNPHSTQPGPELAGMVLIPSGRFLMGLNQSSSPEVSPAHEVTLPAFHLDRTPVTNALFRDVLKSSNWVSGSTASGAGDDQAPVTNVTWDEADAYCLARGKRLPSEAEWEYAARGTDGRLYPWGETFEAKAVNVRESGIGHPEPVGIRPRNVSPFGAADMSGNVWQWCSDDYRPYPGGHASFAVPFGAKVIRGGSYQSDPRHVTAVTRNLELPSKRSSAIGFRCAK